MSILQYNGFRSTCSKELLKNPSRIVNSKPKNNLALVVVPSFRPHTNTAALVTIEFRLVPILVCV